MFLAVRFDQLKVTEWEVIYVFRNMSRANVSYLAPMTTILTESCLDTKSIRFTRANIDSVRLPANCAIGCAAGAICMAYLVGRTTFAGTLSPYLPIFRLLIWTSSQEHSCSALCSAAGICQVDTTPQSVEATFTGRHETFQYTKVRVCSSKSSRQYLYRGN